MKSVFITFDQAHFEQIMAVLNRLNCRGYTRIEQVQGRGSEKGDPHLGSHAWPGMNSAILSVVDDDRVAPLLEALRAIDERSPQLGLRAFVWNVEQTI
ncbi:PG0541 family transporter-associated protein [Tannerella forsythia]|uniref:Uncharacterized protein n=1 Tax=Tannerella forsythia TaxID=28112 RepID=A0A3P1XU33_TANFO|nr:PG0541 family transporter-associated protein [Tannerella forsythia]RRD61985.1 hypothetical protein EII40_05760 [Tannerella forsythia]RRD77780.1 hypothetical protein EII41_03400 [Tannerella forsythia]